MSHNLDKSHVVIESTELVRIFTDKKTNELIHAVDHVSCTMLAGCINALVGPDGAGKTTFIRMATGLITPTSGTLYVLGINSVLDSQQIQDRVAYMPQKFGMYEDLTVNENLELYADLHNIPLDARKKRFEKLLVMTDLSRFTKRLAGNLSGGMKQKLGLACTLVRSPDILFLDEPTVGVDPLSRKELWNILKVLVKDENLSILVSTAYMDEAEQCAQIFVMNKGRILAEGTPEELKMKAKGRSFSAIPMSGMPARLLQSQLMDDSVHVTDAVPRGNKVRIVTNEGIAIDEISCLQGLDVHKEEPEIEDAFMIFLHCAKSQNEKKEETFLNTNTTSQNIFERDNFSSSEKYISEKSQVIIEVKELVRKFGNFTAVDRTSFSICKGEIFGLLGPNGAGKTTTFRMLCGLLPATSGILRIDGDDVSSAPAHARAKIGYVAQKFSLYGDLSVRENLEFFAGVYGLPFKSLNERINEIMFQFDLLDKENTPAGMLPGGYKQRLSMATGLIHKPEILFLDEPTSGIDPIARRLFWRIITKLANNGTTIVITTHFMEEAEYCDRIMIQDAGKMLALGTPSEIRGKFQNMNDAFIHIVEESRNVV